jgi:hypothetical protein
VTILPTVRRQLTQAAHSQTTPAGVPPRAHAGRRRWGGWGSGTIAVAVGVIVVVVVAGAAIVLLSHATKTAPSVTPSTPSQSRRLLAGDGIGDIKFGQSPAAVLAGLRPLFGRPASAHDHIALVPSICGFDHEIDWDGLDIKADGRRFAALLHVYFKHSRFAGYDYFDGYELGNVRAVGGGNRLPLNDPQARQVLRGPRLMLTTTLGLTVGDPIARARQLYGPAFTTFSRPQGTRPNLHTQRLPAWKARTPSGLISGGVASPTPSSDSHGATIGSINAGAIPNTPC